MEYTVSQLKFKQWDGRPTKSAELPSSELVGIDVSSAHI